jgi:hypothetical protein
MYAMHRIVDGRADRLPCDADYFIVLHCVIASLSLGNFFICIPIPRSQHRYGFFSPKLWRYIAAGHPTMTISFDEYGIVSNGYQAGLMQVEICEGNAVLLLAEE